MVQNRPFFQNYLMEWLFWPYYIGRHDQLVLWCQRMPKIYIIVVVRLFFPKKTVKNRNFLAHFCKIIGYWVTGWRQKHLYYICPMPRVIWCNFELKRTIRSVFPSRWFHSLTSPRKIASSFQLLLQTVTVTPN